MLTYKVINIMLRLQIKGNIKNLGKYEETSLENILWKLYLYGMNLYQAIFCRELSESFI